MSSSASVRLCLPLLAVLVLAGCTDSANPNTPAPTISNAAAPDPQALLQATAAAGDVSVRVTVNAKMPSDFDDGVPRRRFTGRGVFDRTRDVVGITYDVSKVPNAAGYLGHIDGDLSVFHGDASILVSSPVIARVLPRGFDWLMYELDDFTRARVLELGIGQLREIALSDPRLALSLMSGADELIPVPTVDGESDVYESEVDLVRAAQNAAPSAAQRFAHLVESLNVETANIRVQVDEEGLLRRIRYWIAYPPAAGSPPVRLRVSVDLLDFGLDAKFRVPPERWVIQYEDYIAPR